MNISGKRNSCRLCGIKKKNIRLFENAALFQLVWFVNVLGDNTWAIIATLAFIVFHCLFFINERRELTLMLYVVVIGYLADTLINTLGMIRFSHSIFVSFADFEIVFPPLWMFCLWLAFSATVMHSLRWLQNHIYLSAILGLSVVPISYYLGAKISGSSISSPVYLSLLAEGVVWSIILSFIYFMSKRFGLGSHFLEKDIFVELKK